MASSPNSPRYSRYMTLIDDATANGYALACGDCRDVLRTLPDNSVDSIVTDPPYELGFMGKEWDRSGIAYNVEVWRQCLRVLKPGGHLLAFGGSRTYHRLACAVEDAGFEIRDQIQWIYGSGFPKSHDVSKAIDKAAGAERDGEPRVWIGGSRSGGIVRDSESELTRSRTIYDAPATDAARQWYGWGTALKPAHEPIVVARKPLIGTVAENVLAHGTGAINVDGCRVGVDEIKVNGWKCGGEQVYNGRQRDGFDGGTHSGRWPANVIHDGSDEVTRLFPNLHGAGHSGYTKHRIGYEASCYEISGGSLFRYGDTGSAARFFYCAKASKRDRDEGLDGFPVGAVHRYGAGIGEGNDPSAPSIDRNTHPTVKPTDLMRYLVRLVTPPGGIVLDPFTGSGSTGKAAMLEGMRFVGVELMPEHVEIARARIAHAFDAYEKRELTLFDVLPDTVSV